MRGRADAGRGDFFTNRMFLRQLKPSMTAAAARAFGDVADALVLGVSLGVTGLAAISLTLPVLMVINVMMQGFAIGGSVRFSSLLAKGEKKQAVESYQGVLCTAVGLGILIAVFGNLFLPQLLSILGAGPEDVFLMEASRTYLRVILCGTPIFFLSFILNAYLRNDDGQKTAGIGFMVGSISDVALNLVLVLGFHMGAFGAAFATLAGHAAAVLIYLTAFKMPERTLTLRPFHPAVRQSFSCFRAGFASSSQYAFSTVFILFCNRMLMGAVGSAGVAVFDMVQNLMYIVQDLYEGTANAAQPLVSTYEGEHNQAGKRRTLRLDIVAGTAAGMAVAFAAAVWPDKLCAFFGLTGQAAELAVHAVRVYCLGIGFAGIGILLTGYFQACGDEKSALLLTSLRGAAVLLPVTVLFSLFGERGFWWLFPVTEILSLIIFGLWYHVCGRTRRFDENRVFTQTIRSKNEELGGLISRIEEFCERWEADMRQSYFVTMTAEELCAAIMAKCFEGDDGYIQITLAAEENGEFVLHIRDSAVSFNPFSLQTEKAGSGGTVDMDAMGVLVIRKKAREFFYRRYQGFNTLIVKI